MNETFGNKETKVPDAKDGRKLKANQKPNNMDEDSVGDSESEFKEFETLGENKTNDPAGNI